MSTYLISEIEISDPVMYEEYRKLVPPSLEKFGAKFIVRGGKCETMEGDWRPKRLVLCEYESNQRAWDWYNSPEYAKAKEVRQKSSTARIIFVEGVS